MVSRILSRRSFVGCQFVLAMLGGPAFADVIHVWEGESIQAAILLASNGDEIIVHPGIYHEGINFVGKAVWLHSSDGAADTIIDATGLGVSVVKCLSGEGQDTTLEGFTITGGNTVSGGGMANHWSSPKIISCIFSGNSAGQNGGGMYNDLSTPTVTNCTFTGNTASIGGGMGSLFSSPTVVNSVLWGDLPNEIFVGVGTIVVSHCDVQGGYPGAGNIEADPMYIDPAGDDYHLLPGSPCIDAGDSGALPPGIVTDLAGDPRFVDDPATPDTGVGFPCVDMGAYEYQLASSCPADVNGDGTVDVLDLLAVLAVWGDCPSCPADINNDGIVNVLDLLEVLAAWGDC